LCGNLILTVKIPTWIFIFNFYCATSFYNEPFQKISKKTGKKLQKRANDFIWKNVQKPLC